MIRLNCIECDSVISTDAALVAGEILTCPDCSVELEVLSLNPLQIDLAPEVEEDWGE